MKKVLVVATLLLVMQLVSLLRAEASLSSAILAAIGFVVLAAYAVAELGRSLSLPQVTGYILAGVALGPFVGKVISGDVLDRMRMFNTLALGLIATSAGLELDLAQIRRLGKTLAFTIGIKVALGVAVVAGVLIGAEMLLGSLGIAGSQLWAVALIMGVLSLGTSPAIVLAVLNETRSKGPLSDLVLGAAIFKDLVVVVALAVAIAVSKVLVQPGALLDGHVLSHVALELGGSIFAGVFVGLLFIAYIRFVGVEMLLFVAAMILVGAEVCKEPHWGVHLELVLVFIAAGFTVRNFSKLEHQLMQPLELVALPVFVVFFTNAGGSIDLATTWRVLPLALSLCGARLLVYVVASRYGGKWGGESQTVQKNAWLAYLPQAGVTLGLVGSAGSQLPELSQPIIATGVAVVALNLLVGPITLRLALSRSGELPSPEEAAPASEAVSSTELEVQSGEAAASQRGVDVSQLPDAVRAAFESTERSLSSALSHFASEVAPNLPQLPDLASKAELDSFRQVVVAHRSAYQALYNEARDALSALPVTLTLMPADAPPRLGWLSRWLPSARSRVIPLRRVARIALEPVLADHVTGMFEAGLRRRVVREASHAAAAGSIPPQDSGLPEAVALGLAHFAELLSGVWTARLRPSRLRYSSVEPRVRHRLQTLAGDKEEALARSAQAVWGGRLIRHHAEQTVALVREAIEADVMGPARANGAKVPGAVQEVRDWLQAAQQDIFRHSHCTDPQAEWRRDFDKTLRTAFGDVSREFRPAAALRATSSRIKAQVATLPTAVECLLLSEDQPLHLGRVRTVDLQHHGETLVRQLLPAVETAVRSASSAVSQVPRRVGQAVKPDWVVFETASDPSQASSLESLAQQRLSRADARVQTLSRITERAVSSALETLSQALETTCVSFFDSVQPQELELGTSRARLQSSFGRVRQTLRAAYDSLVEWVLPPRAQGDAASIRGALVDVASLRLPSSVQRRFSPAPVVDERVFVAHQSQLEAILDAESQWADGGEAAVLISGATGGGKTSLLNMCELESRTTTTLRLHAADFERGTTLLVALAGLLECPPDAVAVRRRLALQRPAIFVDDLPRWVCAAADRQAELRTVLSLVSEMRAEAFCVVTIEGSLLRLFTELEPIEEVFTHVIRLPSFGLREVVDLVESRLRHAAARVQFRPPRHTSWRHQLRLRGDADRFYRWLLLASEGNPARATALALGAFDLVDKKLILRAGLPRSEPRALESRLSSNQLAVLALLHRYGAQGIRRLAAELAMPLPQLQRHIAFLTAAGLVQREEDSPHLFIRHSAQWAVVQALRNSRLVEGSA